MFHYRPNLEGQECCYSANGNLLVGAPFGGTVDLAPHRILSNPWPHYVTDLLPEIYCCHAEGAPRSSCQQFYDVRPSDNCNRYNPDPPGTNLNYIILIHALTVTSQGFIWKI